jgi:RHS repeat-associated protein
LNIIRPGALPLPALFPTGAEARNTPKQTLRPVTATVAVTTRLCHSCLYPVEYLSYGQSSIHNITTRPINPTTGIKEYKIQDHLGSTRVVIDGSGTVKNRTDYDAWGETIWQSGQQQRLSWIGKEKDKENGLGDFGARKYDEDNARFTSIDPLWEKYRSLTPYHYCANNPLIWIDATGLGVEEVEALVKPISTQLNVLWDKTVEKGNEWGANIVGSEFNSSVKLGNIAEGGPADIEIERTIDGFSGETLLGNIHTHPSGSAFSFGDVYTMAAEVNRATPQGTIAIIESGDMRFALEVVDPDKANQLSDSKKKDGLRKIFYDAYHKTDGDQRAKTIAGVQAIVGQKDSGMKFYQSVNPEKTKFKEVKP